MADRGSSHATSDPTRPDDPGTDAPVSVRPSSDVSNDLSPATPPSDPSDSPSSLPLPDREDTIISKNPPIAQSLVPRPSSPLEMGVVLEGETLGHFKLDKFVGGGGMGAVFRATDTMLDRTVAVKILSRDHADEDIVRRFKNEAQSAARLDHDNIARVHYVGEDKGWNYIVFEYIDAQNIRQRVVDKGPLPLDEAISYTLQIAEALEHAARRDVVHRDIKPSNVLITLDGHVKLVDMGLARLHQVESPDRDLTASGVTLGTFDYISPEQARDPRSADVRSDIYSLGCTLYFMLTGQPPFPDGTVLQKLLSHTSDERPDPRFFRPDVPEEVTEILNRMLARNPAERYQRPNELVGELLLLADQLGLRNASRGGTVWITPRQEQPGWLERLVPIVVPVAALFLIVIGLDYFWPARNGNGPTPGESSIAKHPIINPPHDLKDDRNGVTRPREQGNQVNPKDKANSDIRPVTKPGGGTEQRNPETDGNTVSPPPIVVQSDSSGAVGQLIREFDGSNGIGPPKIEEQIALSATTTDGGGSLNVIGDGGGRLDGDGPSVGVEPVPPLTLSAPEIVIVGSEDQTPPSNAQVVDSFLKACKVAADKPSVRAIELWFNGPQVVQPFEISPRSLTISAGEGFSPELVFRPQEPNVTLGGGMLRIVGGTVTWEGIHFRFDLPSGKPAAAWSLFYLDQVVNLVMKRCTMTIVNAETSGKLRQDRVAFFDLPVPPKREMMKGGAMVEINPPGISLEACIARGEATLVRAERVTPFILSWEQGLFITTERLVETGGAMKAPEWHGDVKVALTHVTAVMESGMCLIGAHKGAPHQLPLNIECKYCLLLPGSSPIVEHQGVQGDKAMEERMGFHGRYCFFPENSVVWRLKPLDEEKPSSEIMMGNETVDEKWFNHQNPKRITPNIWRQLPDDLTQVHERTAADYLLDGGATNPALIPGEGTAGFNAERLSKVPDNSIPRTVDEPRSE